MSHHTLCLLLAATVWTPRWADAGQRMSGAFTTADTTAEEIVAACIRAIGGIEAVKAVNDTSYTLTEGEESWEVSPRGRTRLPSDAAESMRWMAVMDGPLIDASAKGVTLRCSGVVTYDMVELQHVTATLPGGVEWEYFFDPLTTSTSVTERLAECFTLTTGLNPPTTTRICSLSRVWRLATWSTVF